MSKAITTSTSSDRPIQQHQATTTSTTTSDKISSIVLFLSSIGMSFLFPKISEYIDSLSSSYSSNQSSSQQQQQQSISNQLQSDNAMNLDEDDSPRANSSNNRITDTYLDQMTTDPDYDSMDNDYDSVKYKRRSYKSNIVEICLSDVESIRHAIQGGANSIELCIDRAQGGVTPSIGLVKQAVQLCKGSQVEVNVLIRPRAGLFTYSHDEFDIILRDIIACERAGATGIVVGILTKSGKIDIRKMKIIRQVAKDMKLTFHRAFDVCVQSLSESLDALMSIPCDRLLTSGKQLTAEKGIKQLRDIMSYVDGRMEIIAACGITLENVYGVIYSSRVTNVHTGSAVTTKRTDSYIGMGTNHHHHHHDQDHDSSVGGSNKATVGHSASSRSSSSRSSSSDDSESHMSDNMDTTDSGKLQMSWLDVSVSGASKHHMMVRSQSVSYGSEFGSWDIVDADHVAQFLHQVDRARNALNDFEQISSRARPPSTVNDDRQQPAGLHRTNEAIFCHTGDSNKQSCHYSGNIKYDDGNPISI